MIKFAKTLFILLFSVLAPSAGFAEELLNALNKAGTVFGTLRLQSGKQADVSLAFYAQDQLIIQYMERELLVRVV